MTAKWTESEVERLKKLFEMGVPDDLIAKIIGRSREAIRVKRIKMRIVGSSNDRRISFKSRKNMSDARKRYKRENHPNWKGGRRINRSGYVEILMPDHPRARGNGYVYEHILVAEQKYGRPINEGEDIHHIDKNKQNNHPDNLVVLTKSEHAKLHPKKKTGLFLNCIVCGEKFYRKKSQAKKAKCCSRNCVGKYTYKLRQGEIKHA